MKLVIDANIGWKALGAFDIASQTRASVYDALYVALAEREGCDLATADEKLIKALPGFPIISLATR